jgi:hypothetical protein
MAKPKRRRKKRGLKVTFHLSARITHKITGIKAATGFWVNDNGSTKEFA